MNFRNCPAQLILFCLILPILLCGCHAKSHLAFINNPELSKTLALPTSAEVHSAYRHYFSMREHLILQYAGKKPQLWGTALPGVLTKSETTEKVLYLTFDACGGKGGNGFDAKLIGYLKQHRIPATLFITNLWIKDHPKEFVELAKWPEFEIENHGLLHRPLSVNGRSAYKIPGTQSVSEAVDEVEKNALRIWQLTGRRPHFYRSSTTYADEFGVKIVQELGYQMVSFSVDGDGGASFSKQTIMKQLLSAPNGSIILLHFNHPEKEGAEGLISALPILQARGVRFGKLQEVKKPNP